jgi:hypothetical protein
MELVKTRPKKINSLEDGPHAPGLRAVLLHIETAFGHLLRGQESGDETAFTDAIYRARLRNPCAGALVVAVMDGATLSVLAFALRFRSRLLLNFLVHARPPRDHCRIVAMELRTPNLLFAL